MTLVNSIARAPDNSLHSHTEKDGSATKLIEAKNIDSILVLENILTLTRFIGQSANASEEYVKAMEKNTSQCHQLFEKYKKLLLLLENNDSIIKDENEPAENIISNFSSALFTPKTRPASITSLLSNCQPLPNLGILDEYRDDKSVCMKFYSYPQFFFDEWKKLMMTKENEIKAAKKQKKELRKKEMKSSSGKNSKKVREVQIKRYNSHGEIITGTGGELQQRYKPVMRDEENSGDGSESLDRSQQQLSQQSGQLNVQNNQYFNNDFPAPPPLSAPNFPPFPPTPTLFNSEFSFPNSTSQTCPPSAFVPAPPAIPVNQTVQMLAGISLKKVNAPETASPVLDKRDNLLMSIRGGANLRKVERPKKAPNSATAESDDVMNILMRRAALECSDSEGDNSSTEDDDWN